MTGLSPDPDWWRGAVIYQIYPRSFQDSNGDGVGDLHGIRTRLDHIAGLGVDAIWISPFFRSPMADFGYDISDYRDVDPIFGSLADFDALLADAHARGLRIMIDQVLSHSSDRHPWFVESRYSRDNPRADWYVWAEPKPDGTPPNNWLSVFGGPAWEWDSRRRQYYLHNFLASQPDLNHLNPEVADAILADVEFWLRRGVDGLRLDAINFCCHDARLRDNPPRTGLAEGGIGVRPDNPYAWQSHVYDKSRPETLAFVERLRALLDRYPGRVSLGEIGCDQSLKTMADYTAAGRRLHMAYSFDLLTAECDTAFLRRTVEALEAEFAAGGGWPCWSIGNHDVVRVATRWGDGGAQPARAQVQLAFLCALRGSLCLYQGEELGLPEAELAYEDLVDPYGIRFWPEFRGRDGCRTPLPWIAAAPNAGFTSGKPWLPLSPAHAPLAVDAQMHDPGSVLHACRALLALRRRQPALRRGAIRFQDAPDGTLLIERGSGADTLLVALNFGAQAADLPLPYPVTALEGAPAGALAQWQKQRVRLPAYGYGYAQPVRPS